MVKKKKIASNPARGFSTTSIPSKKSNVQLTRNVENEQELHILTKTTHIVGVETNASKITNANSTLESGSEGRIESQFGLNREEVHKLKQLVHSNHSKVLSEYRAAQTSSRNLNLQLWVSPSVEQSLIEVCGRYITPSTQFSNIVSGRSQKVLVKHLWSIRNLLIQFGLPPDIFPPALRWLSQINRLGPLIPYDSLQDLRLTVEFLILNYQDLPQWSCSKFYKEQLSTSRSDFPNDAALPKPIPTIPADRLAPIPLKQTVSSLDSKFDDEDQLPLKFDMDDLEPEDLVPRWLELRGQLDQIETGGPSGRSKKILDYLSQQISWIERDMLFDPYEAAELWKGKRIELYHNRQQGQPVRFPPREPSPIPSPEKLSDDENIDLFDMLNTINCPVPQLGIASLILKDFGVESSGTRASPLVVLQQLVQTFDSDAEVTIRAIPRVARVFQSAVVVRSVKISSAIDKLPFSLMMDVNIMTNSSEIQFEMEKAYCKSAWQSNSYISSVALALFAYFQLISSKARLQLGTPWNSVFDQTVGALEQAIVTTIEAEMVAIQDLITSPPAVDMLLLGDSDNTQLTKQLTKSLPVPFQKKRSSTAPELKHIWDCYKMSSSFQEMQPARRILPIHAFKDQIINLVSNNSVLLVAGEPGCGKSTQVPAYIVENALANGQDCKVICTQPRRISAVSLAKRVRQELGEPLSSQRTGSLVGYSVRFDSDISPQSRIIYSTVGVLFRMLESNAQLEGVTHLVIDEVHERNLDTDFLLLIVKKIILTRPDLKVILMSATIDLAKFSHYMGDCPVLSVPGRTFPVASYFLEDAIEMTGFHKETNKSTYSWDDDDLNGLTDFASTKSGIPSILTGYSAKTLKILQSQNEYEINYDLIIHIIKHLSASDSSLINYSGCILIFLPGLAEIRTLGSTIASDRYFDDKWHVHILHSSISSDQQQQTFELLPPGLHKVVLSTNIAETGVTIPDVTCVIDTGKHKEMRYDEKKQSSRLIGSFISRANAQQRRGRAGRVQEGICFHLFTNQRYNTLMSDFQTPETVRLSLKDLISRIPYYDLGPIGIVISELLDPPSARRVQQAVKALIEGNIISSDEKLTVLGICTLKLPLDAHLSKLCILSALVQCVDFGISVAALLSVPSIYVDRGSNKRKGSTPDSDIISLYDAYNSWKRSIDCANQSSIQYCRINGLNHQRLIEAEDMKHQLLQILSEMGLSGISVSQVRSTRQRGRKFESIQFAQVPAASSTNSSNHALFGALTAWAFYPNILVSSGKDGRWNSLVNRGPTVKFAPSSVFPQQVSDTSDPGDSKSQPNFLSYYYLHASADGSNNYANYVSSVDPMALSLFLPYFNPISKLSTTQLIPAVPSLGLNPHDPVQFDTLTSLLSVRPIGGSLKAPSQASHSKTEASTPGTMVLRFKLPDVTTATRLYTLRLGWTLALQEFLRSVTQEGATTKQKSYKASNGLETAHEVAAECFDLTLRMFQEVQ